MSLPSCCGVDLLMIGLAVTSSHSSVGSYLDRRRRQIFFRADQGNGSVGRVEIYECKYYYDPLEHIKRLWALR